MYGSKYVWIIVGWYNDDWWSKPDVDCKGEQLLEAAANMIETLPLPLSTSQQPTISDRVSCGKGTQVKYSWETTQRQENLYPEKKQWPIGFQFKLQYL